MKRKTITLIAVFFGLWLLVFVLITQVLGVPLWWIIRNIYPLETVPIESRFNILISPEAPNYVGDSVIVTVLNASDQMPVEGAKVSTRKDGTFIFDYYTNIEGQTTIEYVGEVTIIEISKSDFKTAIEAIPHAPAKWVRDQNIAMLVGAVGGVVGSLTTYMLSNIRKANSEKKK